MRPVDEIIIHCTATPAGREVAVDDIRRWHVVGNGWTDIGYHYVVALDGSVYTGRPVEQPGAHCRGHNGRSIGVAYVGGLASDGKTPADTRTPAQKKSLERLVAELKRRFRGAVVRGHRDYAAKACPCFDAAGEYSRLVIVALVMLMAAAGCRSAKSSARESMTVSSSRAVSLQSVVDSTGVRFEVSVDSIVKAQGRETVVIRGVRMTGQSVRLSDCRSESVVTDSVVSCDDVTSRATSSQAVLPSLWPVTLLLSVGGVISVLALRRRRRVR